MVPMKTGQIMNQINHEKKTVHSFMRMVQDGTIYHVILLVSIIMLWNMVRLGISQVSQVILSILRFLRIQLLQFRVVLYSHLLQLQQQLLSQLMRQQPQALVTVQRVLMVRQQL